MKKFMLICNLMQACYMLASVDCISTEQCCIDCSCGSECRCADVKTPGQVTTITSLNQLQTFIADHSRIVVKLYNGRCGACAFGLYFNNLVATSDDTTDFVVFNAHNEYAQTVQSFNLPKLPAILLFVNGRFEAILKI